MIMTYRSLLRRSLFVSALPIAATAATLSFNGLAQAEPIGPKTAPQTTPQPAPIGQSRTPVEVPAVSRLLPESTIGLFLIHPEAQRWQDLAQFKTFPQDITTPGWMFSGLVPNLTYHSDIAPWIGGPLSTVMLFNPEQTETTYATIAPVRDSNQMPRFLDRVKRSRDKLPEIVTYKGTSILFWAPEKFPNLSMPEELDPKLEETPDKISTHASTHSSTHTSTHSSTHFKQNLIPDSATPPIPASPTPSPKPPAKPQKMLEYGGFAAAYLKSGFVVTSSKLGTVQQLIDAEASSDRRLAEVPGFQRMLQDDRYPKSLISGYANLGALVKSNQLGLPPELQAFSKFPLFQNQTPEHLTQLLNQASSGIDGFVWAQPEGIQLQAAVHFTTPISPALIATSNSPNALINRVPAVNYGMSGSTNLAFFWRAFTTALESNQTTKKGLKSFRDFSQNLVGVDDRDIFPWMDKEYIGFAFPSKGSPLTQLDPKLAIGFGGFFQTSDRPAATTALKKVEKGLISFSNGEIKITTRKIGDQTLTSWEIPGPSPNPNKTKPAKPNRPTKGKPIKPASAAPGKPVSIFAYQWAADDTLAILSGAETASLLLPKPWQPLDQSVHFKDAIAPLPKENMGYFYLNPPVMLALANQFGLTKMLQPNKAFEPSNLESAETKPDPELDISNIINSIFSIAGTTALQPMQLTSEGYTKLATRPRAKLTAQELIDRAKRKASTNIDHRFDDDLDWAIANYTRALSLEGNNADAYYGRATAIAKTNNHLAAIEDYDRTLQLEPKKVQAYLDRADSKRHIYDYQGSEKDASQALTLTQDSALQSNAYYVRSVAQFNLGNYSAARQDLDQSNTLNPDRIEAIYLQCALDARSVKPEAIDSCNKAVDQYEEINISPFVFNPDALAHRCLVRAQAKDPKAFQDCGKALTADPENPMSHEVQGLARLAIGDRKGAIFSLEKALKIYTQLGDQTAIDRVQSKLAENKSL